jgi:hypothetical protein
MRSSRAVATESLGARREAMRHGALERVPRVPKSTAVWPLRSATAFQILARRDDTRLKGLEQGKGVSPRRQKSKKNCLTFLGDSLCGLRATDPRGIG